MPLAPTSSDVRDTIPRMYHLTYLPLVLEAVSDGASFDVVRKKVAEEARAMSRRLGPVARVPDDGYVHWTTTKDALGESMKLGLLERSPVPSKRAQVDAHRGRRYQLTRDGERLLSEVRAAPSSFRQRIAPLLIQSHAYYAALLKKLSAAPIAIRTYTEEELRVHKSSSSLWIDAVASEVVAHGTETMRLRASDDAVRHVANGIREGLRRRFRDVESPRPKDVLDTLDDLVCALTLERLELPIDAISFNVMMSWNRWLYLADESRYVHGLRGRIAWPAADVVIDEEPTIRWRGAREFGGRIVALLSEVYRDIAVREHHPVDSAPLLPIYEVRATTAYRARVPVALVDHIIAQIADEQRQAPYSIRPQLAGANPFPSSESPFMLGDSPYFVMSLHPKTQE